MTLGPTQWGVSAGEQEIEITVHIDEYGQLTVDLHAANATVSEQTF
ncbi:hypothetical protein [Halocatena salina]|uniref:Uncharacterized protein n=1 Tax=Halocatena salina TaxID=2934340 RepID=A0A8U0AA18_9EURY|nr:hypothetical protein [Halocatena salina]UPM44667.1 hypothetical protein MW046_16650 [Halocatena salina]